MGADGPAHQPLNLLRRFRLSRGHLQVGTGEGLSGPGNFDLGTRRGLNRINRSKDAFLVPAKARPVIRTKNKQGE
jgi:hypothetical protein